MPMYKNTHLKPWIDKVSILKYVDARKNPNHLEFSCLGEFCVFPGVCHVFLSNGK